MMDRGEACFGNTSPSLPPTAAGCGCSEAADRSVRDCCAPGAVDAFVEAGVHDDAGRDVHGTPGFLHRCLDLLDNLGVLGAILELLGLSHLAEHAAVAKDAKSDFRDLLGLLVVAILEVHLAEFQQCKAFLRSVAASPGELSTLLGDLHGLEVHVAVQEHVHHCCHCRELALQVEGRAVEVQGLLERLRRLLHVPGVLLNGGDGVQAAGLLDLVTELLVERCGLGHLLRCQEALLGGLHKVGILDHVIHHCHRALLAQLGEDGQGLLGILDGGRSFLSSGVDAGESGQRDGLPLPLAKLAEKLQRIGRGVNGLFNLFLIGALLGVHLGHDIHCRGPALLVLHLRADGHGLAHQVHGLVGPVQHGAGVGRLDEAKRPAALVHGPTRLILLLHGRGKRLIGGLVDDENGVEVGGHGDTGSRASGRSVKVSASSTA
mmetsp:Transcript_75665/g.171204  ORF Transcript_75665/g.171204 Transcript_75665/m.171204 type:complete len:433 (+) Transcript_75665:111-1409(+)